MADVSTSGRSRNPRVVILGILGSLVLAAGSFAAGVAVGNGGDGRERRTEVLGSTVPPTTTTEAPSFPSLVEKVRSGVARIETATCGDGEGVGAGFLVDRTHVVTVAHVVDDAAAISVLVDEDKRRSARVIGYDVVKEVALLELDRPVDGHVFEMATDPVRIGTEVAALGFPKGFGLSYAQGTVSAVGRELPFDEGTVTDLIQTDTSTNPGNSGGPLMTIDGRVRGLVEAGINGAEGLNFAVASETAIPLVRRWLQEPDVRRPADCDRPRYQGRKQVVEVRDDAPESRAIGEALTRYYQAINDGECEEAWAQYSPAAKARTAREPFCALVQSSFDVDPVLHETTIVADGQAVSHVTFTSFQEAGMGPRDRKDERCTDWSLDYHMVRAAGRWTIEKTIGHVAVANQPCAADDDEPAE